MVVIALKIETNLDETTLIMRINNVGFIINPTIKIFENFNIPFRTSLREHNEKFIKTKKEANVF